MTNKTEFNIYGDNPTVNQNNDNATQIINNISKADHEQIIKMISQLLNDTKGLSEKEVKPLSQAQEILETARPQDQEKLTSSIWQKVNDMAEFTKDKMLPIADFTIEHKKELAAAIAMAVSTVTGA